MLRAFIAAIFVLCTTSIGTFGFSPRLRQPCRNNCEKSKTNGNVLAGWNVLHSSSYKSTHSFAHRHRFTTAETATSLRAVPLQLALPPALTTTDIVRTLIGFFLSQKISSSGYRKKSLSKSGATSAFIVASLSLSCSIRNGLTLLAFYWTGSKLTRIGSKTKETLEEGHTQGGERGAQQVLACSALAVFCACARRLLVGKDSALLFGMENNILTLSSSLALLGDQLTLAYVAFFACCAGDTWASELGVLSRSNPRLVIAPWKSVPPGTNGGVSWVGLGASAAGGILMGLLHGLFVPGGIASLFPSWSSLGSSMSMATFGREIAVLTLVGFMGGLGGSLLDSLLGATVQATYYDTKLKKIAKKPGPNTEKVGGLGFLSNEMVNVVSTVLAALLAAVFARPLLNWMK